MPGEFEDAQSAFDELAAPRRRGRTINTGSARSFEPEARALGSRATFRFTGPALVGAAKNLSDESRHHNLEEVARIWEALNFALERDWESLERELVEAVTTDFHLVLLMTKQFPRLRSSELLAETLISAIESTDEVSDAVGMLFQELKLGPNHARRLAALAISRPANSRIIAGFTDAVARSDHPQSWRTLVTVMLKREERSTEPTLDALLQLLRLLPKRGFLDQSWDLDQVSPATRRAWLKGAVDALSSIPDFAAPTLEVVLWWGESAADHLVLTLGVQICRAYPEAAAALADLRMHPETRVRLRAEAIEAALRGELVEGNSAPVPDLIGALAGVTGTSITAEGSPRTWIGDRAVELMIERAAAAVAARFVSEYDGHWRQDEETLTTRLLTLLEVELEATMRAIAEAERSGRSQHEARLNLTYRLVPKTEEGGPGVDAPQLATDICLVVEASRNNEPFAARATLLQAKKLRRGENDRWEPSFKIDSAQRTALSAQTSSSFYLFFGPGEEGRQLAVVPAQLVGELLSSAGFATALHREDVNRASRSLSSWFVYDLVGLWVGDPNLDLVQRAAGDEGRRPYLLAKIGIDVGSASRSR